MDIRVAAYGIITRGETILLSHWNEHGHSGWTLPGGGIDPGEHPDDALLREIEEETGYLARRGELIGVDSVVIPEERRHTPGARGPLQALRIVYRAEVIGGELRYEVGGSTDWAAWHPIDSLGELDTVGLVPVALRLLEERGGSLRD